MYVRCPLYRRCENLDRLDGVRRGKKSEAERGGDDVGVGRRGDPPVLGGVAYLRYRWKRDAELIQYNTVIGDVSTRTRFFSLY